MAQFLATRPNDRRLNRRALKQGMTLMELLLVVAIMVVIAALAAPSVQRTIARQTLRSGADRVRVAMGQARVRAIREGEEFAVFYMPDGGWFNVAPYAQYQEQSNLAARQQQNVENGVQTDFEDDMLPRGVKFAATESIVDARAAETMEATGASGTVKMILFYPDGTSQDARITLQNQVNSVIDIELRGLTGIAKTVRSKKGASVQ